MTKILIKRHANIVRDKHRVPTQFPLYRHTWIRVKLALCIKKGGKSINTIRDIGIGWISLIEQTRGGGKFYRRPCILLITHTPCAAWPDGRGSIIHRSQSRSSVFIRLTINVTGRGLKMHQPFTRSYDEGAIRDLGRFRRVLNDHFCRVGGEREGRGIVKYNGH